MGNAWIQARKKDQYYRLAIERGYRSRAAFKILQANDKYHFVRKGDTVVDLGCAPGGWSQALCQIVTPLGRVLGIDTRDTQPLDEKIFFFLRAELSDAALPQQALKILGRYPNAVVSDAAPNITGSWDVDHERQISLAYSALHIALSILVRGGSFFAKLFDCPLVNEFRKETSESFTNAHLLKPDASRTRSSELYILARGFTA